MQIFEIITTTQVLVGAALLVMSVVLALKTLHRVSEDLRKRWLLLIVFLVFFVIAYLLFLYVSLSGFNFRMELITGSVFMAGACFVVLVMMITKTTLQRIHERESDLEFSSQSLSESEEKYRSLVESTDDSIYVVDRQMKYIFMNEKHQSRLKLSEEEYSSVRSYGEFHSQKQTDWFSERIGQVFETGKPSQYEYQSERDDRHFMQTMSPVKSSHGEIVGVSVISQNITSLKNMEEKLRVLTLTDDLTGLYNRRGFFTLAEQQLKMANRLHNGAHLLYVDLDYLKLINDNLGHNEGDKALVRLAEILKVTYRESDIIARIGGDEFAVFPVEAPDGDIKKVTRRLITNIEQSNSKGADKFELSISSGMAYYNPETPVNLEELLSEADKSMYEQKKLKPRI